MSTGKLEFYADDISKLEINSMLVDGIWGRKMPHPSAAFCEITSAWVHQLNSVLKKADIQKLLSEPLSGDENGIIVAVQGWNANKGDVFDAFVAQEGKISDFMDNQTLRPLLKEKAMGTLRSKIRSNIPVHPLKREDKEDDAELFRLVRILTRLILLLKKFRAFEGDPKALDFRDRQQLRKLWELKDGYIFAQNTIQLDGDIITRINRRMHGEKLSESIKSDLMSFHQQNVDIGLKNWQFLVNTLIAFIKGAANFVIDLFVPKKIP
jgi:hypothetical protein